MILERERLTSVPIGIPISNCDVLLVCENDTPNQGEIYVGGACLCGGYYSDGEKLPHNSVGSSFTKHGSQLFFKTGDFARRLQSGDLVFLGRKDRTVKVSGHRIALEEVEDVLRRHPDVVDAAVISVISSNAHGELVVLEAFIVLKEERSCEIFRSSIGSWMIDKLPVVMLPNRFTFRKTLPVSSNGKVDYGLLESSSSLTNHVEDRIDDKGKSDLLQVIKKAFCDALMVEEVSNDDDFFTLGGNSIASAHLAHNLGVNMRLIYYFPSPSKLYLALLERKGSCDLHVKKDGNLEMNLDGGTRNMLLSMKSVAPNPLIFKPQASLSNTSVGMDGANALVSKCLKMDSNIHFASDDISHGGGYLWNSSLDFVSCSFSRSNKVIYEGGYRGNGIRQGSWSMKIPRGRNGFMQDFWKVHMESCIDASPMVVFRGQDIYLFIGSHSRKFLCICGKRYNNMQTVA
ncbi:hypothetical protein CIPAW_01G087400 [Carya illinoinensis]|uniref:Carrier domain-containing protein n=1 Tax=Carya illinoinensis TaxID=32201 RepID=A0A8T1RJH4_CARIL|nr:hypothetical protein CIPAW_01G087400 [Carya illinoinensis]